MAEKIKIGNKLIFRNLDSLLESSPEIELNNESMWVVFSDTHMGDGSSTDDFKANSQLFTSVLSDYYQNRQCGLILNGDIEELLRFPLDKIEKTWPLVYKQFDQFAEAEKLIKTIGNHDLQLGINKNLQTRYEPIEAARLKYKENHINIFHGHQASKSFQEHSEFVGFTLKYFANPLGIKNYSVAHDSIKKYKIEKRIYSYSSFNKNATIIGHTHRPLFESMHKVERIKFRIEQLCREYASSEPSSDIIASLKSLKKDLKKYVKKQKINPFSTYIYNEVFHVPCLFNSGCVIGKRGMTCLEISDGKIRLVHWFDKNISKKYLRQSGYQPEQLGKSDFYRMVINEESLDYIFTRIKFLA